MIKYRKFIEQYFMIDVAKTGQLVPFLFNPVQEKYYDDLQRDYRIEEKGINIPIRENILKARREGFSSFILALFAADDLTNDNPTQTDVLSYIDDATDTFRRRYRTFLLTFFLKEIGKSAEEIQSNINLLEEIAPDVLSIDSTEIEIKENKAKFQCNTASARVGGRGGVRHKILFSENAFYPDTPKIKAAEMISATEQQVDPDSGWIFLESTENGIGTYQHKLWDLSTRNKNRYKNRFYGAAEFYTPERIATIKSGYVDMELFRRDYPMDEEDLFKGSAKSFTTETDLNGMIASKSPKGIEFWMDLTGVNYIDQAEMLKSQLETLEKMNRGHALYAGLDTAKKVDRTVLTVLKDARKDLSGGVKILAIDVTNGDFMADWFEKNTNWTIEKVTFSRPSKSLMYTNLQVVIADRGTRVPILKVGDEWVSDESMRFSGQMLGLKKELKGNLLVVAHPEGNCAADHHDYDECPYHDDYADSWMLAEHAFTVLNGVPALEKRATVQTIPNAIDNLLGAGARAKKKYKTGGFE